MNLPMWYSFDVQILSVLDTSYHHRKSKMAESVGKPNSIQDFYAGKTIFITGPSGFMGKVLIEKLLYSCSEVKELIILMRPKKGKSVHERVESFSKLAVS